MKHFTLALVAFTLSASSQVTINKTDFAVANDTVRVSAAATAGGGDYTLTGANVTWDFSQLVSTIQKVDTFKSVGSTPLLYQLYFNNQFLYPKHKATVAQALPSPTTPGGTVTIDKVFGYYKALDGEYTQVGFGATINTLPASVKFDSLDVIYRLPLTYGNSKDSCHSKYVVSVPNLGYYGQKKDRVNTIDGWGTLKLPMGDFQTVRVRSKVNATDTMFISQYNYGFNTKRATQYEYKWLGVNGKEPYLTVVTTANQQGVETVTSVSYRDIKRPVPQVGIVDQALKNNDFVFIQNPTSANAVLQYELRAAASVTVDVFSLQGQKVQSYSLGMQSAGMHDQTILRANLPAGVYFVQVLVEDKAYMKKLIFE